LADKGRWKVRERVGNSAIIIIIIIIIIEKAVGEVKGILSSEW